MRALRWATRHRRGGLAALALAVAAGVVVGLVLVAGSPAPTTAAGAANTSSGAATVKRRNLVQTDTESGTLSYANPQTVYDRLSGTITWLPGVGRVVKPGGTLFRVDGEPVTLMDGGTPAYRTLSAADTDGADVLELNRNLAALGFNANGIVVDDEWQEATTLGVELLQESLGESPTGSLSLGTLVFLPGPQLVATVDGTVGANGGGSGTPASLTGDSPAPEFVSLTTPGASLTTTSTTQTTSTSTTGATPAPHPSPHPHRKAKRQHGSQTSSLAALLALLRAQSAQLKAETEQLKAAQSQNQKQSQSGNNSPAKSSSSGDANSGSSGGGGSGSGGGGGAGTAVLQTTSNHLVVTVDLDASLQSEAKVGERVTVQLPAGNTVNGKVTAVSAVAQSSSSGDNGGAGGAGGGGGGGAGGGGGGGSGSSSTVPVTVTLSGHHAGAGLDEAAVSVSFAQQRANHVLSVPVTALVAVAGGNYALQEAAAPHTLIPVTVGLFAAGYVQVSGAGIHPGLQVTDSQG